MYLKYGSYQHASGETAVVITKQGLFTDTGIARGVRERWDIQGRLQAASPAAVTTALNALAAAYAVQGLDIGFYEDDNTPTSHFIDSSATNGGVRVVSPPSFPQGRGAEYSTFRTYTLSVEAEWLAADQTLLNWRETLRFTGGGPQFAFLQPITGVPVKQVLRQATTYKATQSGEAVGFQSYPSPPGPIWPTAEHVQQRQIHYELPRRMGKTGLATLTDYKISWSYEFESATPLLGLPSGWPS